MISVALLFLYSLALLISVTGWGWIIKRVLSRNTDEIHGPAACLGLATLLAIAGVLNVVHALRPAVYVTLFLTGVVSFVVVVIRLWSAGVRIHRRDATTAILWLFGIVAALPMMSRLLTAVFNPADDAHAYLVAIKRVIDLGSVGADPFNYRMFVSGGGAMASLQAPVELILGWWAVKGFDQVFGTLLFVTSLIWLIRRRGVPFFLAAVMLFGTFAIANHDIANVTSYFMTLALLTGLFCFLTNENQAPVPTGICAGLLLAALTTLKYTSLPPTAMLIGLALLFKYRHDLSRFGVELLAILVSTGVPVLIWALPQLGTRTNLIALRHGSGFDEVSAGYLLNLVTTSPRPLYMLGYLAGLVLMTIVAFAICRHTPEGREIVIVFLAVVLGCIATTWATGGVAITRYNRPFTVLGCLLLVAIAGNRASQSAWLSVTVAVTFLVAMALSRNFAKPWTYWDDYKHSMALMNTRVDSDPPLDAVSGMQTLQSKMDPAAAALIRLDKPYLLNFARNHLYVIDFPYAASPAPGMGNYHDVPGLIGYLKAHGIRYVAYSYGDEANFPASMVRERLALWYFTPWQRALNRNVPPFNRIFQQLIEQQTKVYDDGHDAVVDLMPGP
jgi:hypothetical protein